MSFCIKCGAKLADEADFCHRCGARVEFVPGQEVESEPSEKYGKATYYPETTSEQQVAKSGYRRKKHLPAIAISLLIISGLVITPIVLIAVFGSFNFVYLDTQTYSYEELDTLNVELLIDNDLGFVSVSYDSSIDGLFEATIDVKGRKGADTSKIKEMKIEPSVDYTLIEFDSGDQNFIFWNRDVFQYEISLVFNPQAIILYQIYTSTGKVDINLNGNENIYIPDLSVTASTGHVDVTSGSTEFLVIDNLHLTTSTGYVELGLTESFNATLGDFYVETSTGSINIDLGKYTLLNTSDVRIKGSTSSVDLSFEDLIFTDSINWDISVSTGGIELNIIQNLVTNVSFESLFDLETSTGKIRVNYVIDEEIGLKFEAVTSTGDIDIPADTSDYASRINRFYFDMETSTGGISANQA